MEVTQSILVNNYIQQVNEFVSMKSKELIESLNKSKSNSDFNSSESSITDYLLNLCCKVCDTTLEEVFRKKCTPQATECADIVIVILKQHTNLTLLSISKAVKKKTTDRVYRAINAHNTKDPKIKIHRVYLERYAQIESEFLQFKNGGVVEDLQTEKPQTND